MPWARESEPRYSGDRANSAAGGGLCASAQVPAGRCLRGAGRRRRGVRCESLSAQGREVPRPRQRGDLSDLSKRAADVGFVGVRRWARPSGRVGADARGTDSDGRVERRILGACRRGMPLVQLESSGAVVRARHGSRACQATDEFASPALCCRMMACRATGLPSNALPAQVMVATA